MRTIKESLNKNGIPTYAFAQKGGVSQVKSDRMKHIACITLITILSISTVYSQQNSLHPSVLTDEFIYTDATFPSVHSATIEETPAGLITAFFGGEYEGHPEVNIYVSRLSESGWTAPAKVVDGIVNDTLRKACYNPVLYQVPGRELILFYKIGKNVQDWSGHLIRSYDHGITWTKPEDLPEGFLGPIKNRPLLVGETLVCGSSTENDGWKVHFEFTQDFGRTWTKTSPINEGDTWSIIQPSLLSHEDGRLQMVCRSRNEAVVSAFSADNGKTWGEPFALEVPNNNSGIDAIPLQDGRFLMVYNHVKATESAYRDKKRTPLNVAVSRDGIHWNMEVVLVDSPVKEYSYPSVIQSKDGMVHIVYTWRREKVRYVKISFATKWQVNSAPGIAWGNNTNLTLAP